MTSRKDNAPASEPSSPVCSMHEADDAYMGYAGKEELTAILTELLEAERAGVRVTHESARTAGDARVAELMRAIEADEARWCTMLARHLRMLGRYAARNTLATIGKTGNGLCWNGLIHVVAQVEHPGAGIAVESGRDSR